MAVYAVAGRRFFIGGTIDTDKDEFTESDFSGETWVEVDGWETMGSVGDTAETITTQLINRGRDIKMKGTRNAGSMENTFAVMRDDQGQIELRAAETTDQSYAFRILHPEGPEQFFGGLVMSAQEQGGSANTVQMLSATIEVNTNVVTVMN